MKILLFKLSSLGDLLHVFPALSALQKAIPELEVTWVVETAFQEVPLWHPAVKQVIPAPLRQLRKEKLFTKIKSLLKLVRVLRRQKYEVILDAQGLYKSALLAKCARGKLIGLGKGSARESVSWLYDQCVDAPWTLHAITRLAALFSAITPIQIDLSGNTIDYALRPWQPHLNKILFFAHGTTWPSKHYPDVLWLQLVELATATGYQVWLPYVNNTELKRATFLKINDQVRILSKMDLNALKEKLYEVSGMIAVDTGLAHIGAALGVPTVTLYGPTDPTKIGTIGRNQLHLAALFECAPCEKKACFHPARFTEPSPPCFRMLMPTTIFAELQRLIANTR